MQLQKRQRNQMMELCFISGVLMPDSQVFHDTHFTKIMRTRLLLNILEDCLL